MDRRVVVGLVGIWLAGIAQICSAQTQPASSRDSSPQAAVGLAPIPSISESINSTTGTSGYVAMAPSAVPSSTANKEVDAILPKSPLSTSPVSISPMDPIHRSINRGFGTGMFSSMFRKPAAPPTAAATLRVTPRVEPAPKIDRMTIPSILSDASAKDVPAGRPSPFAGRTPSAPRVQADPSPSSPLDPGPGRPAPYAEERPRAARPRSLAPTTSSYRPAQTPSTNPMPVQAPSSSPALLPSTPEPVVPTPTALEPASPAVPLELLPVQAQAPVPPIEVAPEPSPAPSSVPALAPVSGQGQGPVDSEVSRTSLDETAVRTNPVKPRQLPYATMRAAAVGDEIITMNELTAAVNEKMKDIPGNQIESMSEEERFQLKNQVAASVLNGMIDQSLVVHRAKRTMLANPKAKQMFDDMSDKAWKTDELPPLLRNTASTNVQELKIKLTAQGKSYDSMKEAFRKNMLFREFLRAEIHNKLTADMIEMRAYYNEHLDKFEQPARMTWREIEINFAKYPDRAAARQKAEEILARLLRNDDFDAVARSISNGPTASKGGLYVDMQPGSYGIPVVNDELNRIPTGQVSKILEAPGSFHIIRVDSRRDKGPLRFDEVQDKVRSFVMEQNFRTAVDTYLAKLRANTVIRTKFDNTASDPELARRNDPSVKQASGTR